MSLYYFNFKYTQVKDFKRSFEVKRVGRIVAGRVTSWLLYDPHNSSVERPVNRQVCPREEVK